MNQKGKKYYFLGIGGIGMSALAKYLFDAGNRVMGYDKTPSPITSQLIDLGISVLYDQSPDKIPEDFCQEDTQIVYTPAVPLDHPQLNFFIKQGNKIKKRAVVLGEITKETVVFAIAGTHGKTTTASFLTHYFAYLNLEFTAFLGGIMIEYQSNLVQKGKKYSIVEADEYDRSFLQLFPDYACITAMDADHLDIYGTAHHLVESFRLFSDKVEDGNLIVKEGLDIPSKYTYALSSDTADFSAKNIRVEGGAYYFDLVYPKGVCENVISGLPGIHNVENALAAFSMAYIQGLSVSGIVDSIASFSGVKRRFEYHIKTDNQIYIDDYAHHPKEIEVAIRSVRDLYPNKELTVVFQPHLFSRTRDFMDDFAKALSCADNVMLLDVYPARELPIDGVNSSVLLDKITVKNKGLYDKSKFPEAIDKSPVIMTLGAGDIDELIQPIKAYLVS